MKPEIYLDDLLKRRERGEPLPSGADDEIEAGLAASEKLARLQEIPVPPRFARELEASLRLSTRRHHQTQPETRVLSPMLSPHPRPIQKESGQTYHKRRDRLMTFGFAALLVLVFTLSMTAIYQSRPGDPFYPWKQAGQQFTSNLLHTPDTHTQNELTQLHNAIAHLDQVVKEKQNNSTIQQALDSVITRTASAQEIVKALPAGSERQGAQQQLEHILSEENQMLYALLRSVDWSMKLQFTQQLGRLGNTVLQVKTVTTHFRSDESVWITLVGAYFAPGATCVIDGQARGSLRAFDTAQLIVSISHAEHFEGIHTFGILNPDGTAAQITVEVENDDSYEQDYDDPRP